MTKKEEKNEIIEANYSWNIHLMICSKVAFLNRSWLVEIAPVNLCKLLSNLLWVYGFSYDQIVWSLGEPFHAKQPDYFYFKNDHFLII